MGTAIQRTGKLGVQLDWPVAVQLIDCETDLWRWIRDPASW